MIYALRSDGEHEALQKNTYGLRLSCALGCFDGVHIGHRTLLRAAVNNFFGYTPAIWTFSSPLARPFIDPINERLRICAENGISLAICEDFEFVKDMSPKAFISHLVQDFGVGHFIVGEGFRFGASRAGDTDILKNIAKELGASTTVVSHITVDGEQKVSSSLIRDLIKNGEIERANSLLMRPMALDGTVVGGKQIGRTMSLPTVNLSLADGRIIPKNGVYDTVCIVNGARYPSITNIGSRPTVNNDPTSITCETHIIGADIDLYGENVKVEFLRYARPEKQFGSLDMLKDQINSDIEKRLEHDDIT